MKKNTALPYILATLLISACGAATPQATPVPASATQSVPSPTDTQVPATNSPIPPTDTLVPATETPTESASTAGGVSFTKDVLPIFNDYCTKCHGVEQVKEGLDITTYEALMAGSFNGPVIVPGISSDSYLVQQIVEGEMPKRGPGLTDQQIKIISDWVNQGAQNN